MSEYGNLRRRTRDAGWQWLLMGVVLGMGAALVVCVGGYALGALTFPLFEADTATPVVQIEPNQTEIAMQTAAAAPLVVVTEEATEPMAMDVTEEVAVAELPATDEMIETEPPEQAAFASPTPSPLPGGQGTEAEATVSGADDAQQPDASSEAGSGERTTPLGLDTPVVGTPPFGTATATVVFASRPAVPAELQAIQSSRVTIPGGTFQMGTTTEEGLSAVDECALYEATGCTLEMVQDSTPPHPVTVDSFEIETTEVSLAQYVAFLNYMGPSSHASGCLGQPCAFTKQEEPNSYIAYDGTTYSVDPQIFTTYPAIWITWWGAEAYCNALNGRLPTEAEWERAARGEAGNIYPWGFDFNLDYANSNRPLSDADGPEPVNGYSDGRTPTGLYNMAGNVAEWVEDWYQSNYYSEQLSNPNAAVNPQGPVSGSQKVIRGGSWDTVPLFLRSVHRQSWAPGEPTAFIGFRCVFENTNLSAPSVAPTDQSNTSDTTSGGAPTLAPVPTRPTSTPGPTATLAPG